MTSMMDHVNAFIQHELRRQNVTAVPAVTVARWLDRAGILTDSASRPGLPLRRLLRAGLIAGSVQRPPTSNGRWFITPVAGSPPHRLSPPKAKRVRAHRGIAGTADAAVCDAARRRRARAAGKYRPSRVKLLLVAEAPPAALDRYFYFEDVNAHDSLFRYVARGILDVEPTRANKPELLGSLKREGVFLIDLKRDPVDGAPLTAEVPGLLARVKRLRPDRMIVIKSSVFDLVRLPLLDAGLPLVDERVPFPGSGQQRRFEQAFARALSRRPSKST